MGLEIEPFPAPSRSVTGSVDGTETEVSCTHFSDKILVTISQQGRLAQWIQVPMCPSDVAADGLGPVSLPVPVTLLGGDRDTLGQLYASQLAKHLALRNPAERRTLLLGLGLSRHDPTREAFFGLIELVQQVL